MKNKIIKKQNEDITALLKKNITSLEKSLQSKEEIISKLNTLINVNHIIASSLDRKKVLKTILDQTKKIMNCVKASLLLVDKFTNQLHFFIMSDDEDLKHLKNVHLNMGEGIAGSVWKNGSPLLIENAQDDTRFSDKADAKSDNITTSIMAVPLISNGKIIGVMEAVNKVDLSFFNELDFEIFQNLATQAAIAIDNATLYELAIYDGKTRLFIHRYFILRLEEEFNRAKRYNGKISIIMLDIDFFKKVNDTYGHQTGDEVLIQIAKTIKKTCRAADIASRFGGEEFAILLTETTVEGSIIFAEKIRNKIEEIEFISEDIKFKVTISGGIVTYPNINAESGDELIDFADKALYHAKENGRNRISEYKDGM